MQLDSQEEFGLVYQNDTTRNVEGNFENIATTLYIAQICLFQIIFIYSLYRAIRSLQNEFRSAYLDVFRVIQMAFIIGFLCSRNFYSFLCRIPGFEFFHLPTISISTFFFYYFETINNICWATFILHLKACDNPKDFGRKVINRLWHQEMTLLTYGLLTAIPLLTSIVVIMISSWAFDCTGSELYFIEKQNFTHHECGRVHRTGQVLAHTMFGVGALAALNKLVIGIYMLKVMKRKLHVPYQKVKRSVIVTIIATFVVIGMNAFLNYNEKYMFTIFWVYTIVPASPIPHSTIILKFFMSLINVIAEVALMSFTADNIDFRDYLIYLMNGRERIEMLPEVSIFLKFRRQGRQMSLRASSMLAESQNLKSSRNRSDQGEEEKDPYDPFCDSDAFINFEAEGTDSEDFTSRKYTEVFDKYLKRKSEKDRKTLAAQINTSTFTSDNTSSITLPNAKR